MRKSPAGTIHRRTLTASILLVAFAVRALIPPGFMPATDRPFSLEICWEGLPSGMLQHGESMDMDSIDMDSIDMGSMDMASPHAGSAHAGHSSHTEHCVFGTACSAGPISHPPLLSDLSFTRQLRTVALVSVAGAVRLVHLPQPRAPPGQLS
jgi:hypothetical protein